MLSTLKITLEVWITTGANLFMHFRIIGKIESEETFATGGSIREVSRLRRIYGKGRWRKRKGVAKVEFDDGRCRLAELHWYEATGIGRREFKIKQFPD
jgi:hypothetical protein